MQGDNINHDNNKKNILSNINNLQENTDLIKKI